MIFVTVGFHEQAFARLVAKMDDIAGRIDEEVIIQKGNTPYETKNASSFDFLPSDEEYMEILMGARIIVSHGGAGTILNSLIHGKRTVVVPRLRKYGEHVNDHQLELSDALKEKGLITVVEDVNQLEEILSEDYEESFVGGRPDDSLSRFIGDKIVELTGSRSRD